MGMNYRHAYIVTLSRTMESPNQKNGEISVFIFGRLNGYNNDIPRLIPFFFPFSLFGLHVKERAIYKMIDPPKPKC